VNTRTANYNLIFSQLDFFTRGYKFDGYVWILLLHNILSSQLLTCSKTYLLTQFIRFRLFKYSNNALSNGVLVSNNT
jgi:hypothetical protein